MCDICSDVLALLESHDERVQKPGGLQLRKEEVFEVMLYVQAWQARQCMCCYKDCKNFEHVNNIVQVILNLAIKYLQTLPEDCEKANRVPPEGDAEKKDAAKPEENKEEKSKGKEDGDDKDEKDNEDEGKMEDEKKNDNDEDEEKPGDVWDMDEKDRLLQFVTRIFLINFPLYVAYKHSVHSTLEDLSQQEASALTNYCELSDPEIPVYLLRNICFFCDRNGIQAIRHCFERGDPDTFPIPMANTLITIVANLRLWMNMTTVTQYIVPLRPHVIRYMCKMSDKDLRMAGTRSMTELMWAAVKEPLETHLSFDCEGLDLAFKYFTCSTLTIRLAGITQINNQINLYNELTGNDNLMEADKFGTQLAKWLTTKKIVECIFGPNLHVELIKQSQMILNFMAMEGRITKEHIDCIWASAQLKHCGRQVLDVLIPLIKHLEVAPTQHLLKLVASLEPSCQTEQTLYLASALIKYLWNTATAAAVRPPTARHHNDHTHFHHGDACTMGGTGSGHVSQQSSSDQSGSDAEMVEVACPGSGHSCKREPQIPHVVKEKEKEGDSESENSSLCVNSELSNVSEGSLPEDPSDAEDGKHSVEKLKEMGHFPESSSLVDRSVHDALMEQSQHISDTDYECSESSDEMDNSDEVEELPSGQRHIKHMPQIQKVEGQHKCGRKIRPGPRRRMNRLKVTCKFHLCPPHGPRQPHSEHESECEGDCGHEPGELGCTKQGGYSYMDVKYIQRRHKDKKVCDESVEADEDPDGDGDHHIEESTEGSHNISTDQDMSKETLNTSCESEMLQQMGVSHGEGDSQVPTMEGTHGKEEGEEVEQFDCRGYIKMVHQKQGRRHSSREEGDDILSPDQDSCNSSRLSNKSEKNMADFEGEDIFSEDELVSVETQVQQSPPVHRSAVHPAPARAPVRVHPGGGDGQVVTPMSRLLEDVCKPGQTLLWDLVQDDKAHLLPEGLAQEAEKALCSLVCFSTERGIRTKFIKACVENVANHKSTVISLRLLPKLFGSFQQYRTGLDTYAVTMRAERELDMMKHFFNDLKHFTDASRKGSRPGNTLYSYKEEIQVRLQFLTCVFSIMGSPDTFRLSLDQVDTLWGCLAKDSQCCDELFTWFLNQAKSKEHHALGLDTFRHLFLEKMPQLEPESMSMVGLNLFTQLCHLARIANASLDKPLPEDQISGMSQVWGIALRAQSTDVSLTAVQYLNNYYINYGSGILEKEEEFVSHCMDSLGKASSSLEKDPERNLLVIQRGLLLLTTHLESFRKRYAFHLRNWQLDNQGITSHQKSLQDKQATPIRVVLQPAGSSAKTTFEMLSSDLVAELRAEVTRWWEGLQRQQKQQQQQMLGAVQQGSVLTPILGAMLGDGPIRMITLGQELTVDMDEQTLSEMQFRDLQLVYVSVGASRPPRKHDGSTPASYLPAPNREKIPMMLLLAEPHFDNLFNLLQQLSHFKCSECGRDQQEAHGMETKARVMSRRVWELLMLLPTNPAMLRCFKSIKEKEDECTMERVDWNRLLDAQKPHKLMYSLQIVESLSRLPKHRRKSVLRSYRESRVGSSDSELSVDDQELPEEIWSREFVKHGGLKHLFEVFMSGTLQEKDEDTWNEWNLDCLAYLLRLMNQFAVTQTDSEVNMDDVFETFESPRKRMKKFRGTEKLIIPKLNETILEMLEVQPVLKAVMSILYEAAMPRDVSQWHTGSWGRTEVVHYALSFLVCLVHSCVEVGAALCQSDNFSSWLKRLTLEAPEPGVRKEATKGIYKMVLGRTEDGQVGYQLLQPILASLLISIKDAQSMKPRKKEEDKEPYGPGCRDYFWLACRLVDSISLDDAESTWMQAESAVDLNILAQQLAEAVMTRSYLERRPCTMEDEGLVGLLSLCTMVMKHNPPYRTSPDGQKFLTEVFWLLFALPSQTMRYLPKAKSQIARTAAYDLLVEMVKGSVENYTILYHMVLDQHKKDSHAAYPWNHWPHEDGRSKCGFVGLTNLGATCYMATCMQHLYMIPQARKSILEAQCSNNDAHKGTLMELQKMFAYLLESERKAYNPRSFCKVYTMDHQPLNTGEQKDMTEFFTDLISKLEEMSPGLKSLVKSLFGGVITNNVVSLDCPHVSRTKEEFYTVRCQVSDMKNLYESLNEVTVKDTLEGDNMYTCSECQKKVRAEKRACFKRLPKILCFNTMRYTFNMVTMMKEKVNTHFSFPLRLDMAGYMEQNLIQSDKISSADSDIEEVRSPEAESYDYELIGVTVHTGTADGGHYYSFIRDRLSKNEQGQDKWYLFNDAEVKPFDPAQIAQECFGGEMTSKTYDQVTDKFMDFSFEKTNSAYMLFYERIPAGQGEDSNRMEEEEEVLDVPKYKIELSQELADWIWQDNMQFLQDRNLFEHSYFGFMWQMCSYVPSTLPKNDSDQKVQLTIAKLGTSFVLETLIHAKEKPTMLQWIELLTKQFNACPAACEWFLGTMAEDDWWPQQILIKCPIQMARAMFQRLVQHMLDQLKPTWQTSEDEETYASLPAFRFIRKMFSIIEHNVKPQSKYLTEYFALLYEFARLGDVECRFLNSIGAITIMVNFYMRHHTQDSYVEVLSDDDDDDDEEVIITEEKYRPQTLEKMIALISLLVEKSRGEDNRLHLSEKDHQSLIGGKGFPFLLNQIRDGINIRQTCNLLFSLCRWNERLAIAIIQMIYSAVTRLSHEQCAPFFKLLSQLVEIPGGPPGMPPFTQFVLQKFWEVTEYCPQQCLDWLSAQVTRNKIAHNWVLQGLDTWVELFLMAHNSVKVRNAAANLLVALVPSSHFRQAFRSSRSLLSPHKDVTPNAMNQEALAVLHEIYKHLLSLMPRARLYVDAQTHGTMKLVPFFAILSYCLISHKEKLMFSKYFNELWQLFQPRLSEPAIAIHHNKQALLLFWYQACVDCPDNVKLIVTNPHVAKNIAFNYILADHDDQELVLFNRCMLPAYYGILRMCCQQSRAFTCQMAQHENIHWAFKNITPYPTNFTAACDELFKMMQLMATSYPDSSEDEVKAVQHFRRTTLHMYLQRLDARSSWQTLIQMLKILVVTPEERQYLVIHSGLPMLHEACQTLFMMYHNATACHVTGDIVDLFGILQPTLKVARQLCEQRVAEVRNCLYNWVDRMDLVRKLVFLLNSYMPPEIRQSALDVLKEMVLTFQNDSLQLLVPILINGHTTFQDNSIPMASGPYFPKRGQKPVPSKANIRPPRPQFQMFLLSSQMEAPKGVDEGYDQAMNDYFYQYHLFIDLLVRVAVNQQNLTQDIISLSAMVAYEGVPLHLPLFPKLWCEIYHSEHVDKQCIQMLCNCPSFIDYVDAVLLDERRCLNIHIIYQFFCNFFPKVYQQVLNEQGQSLLDSIVASITSEQGALETVQTERDLMSIMQRLNGDVRALLLMFSVQPPKQMPELLEESLQAIRKTCQHYQAQRAAEQEQEQEGHESDEAETPVKRRRTSSDADDEGAKKMEEQKQELEEPQPSTSGIDKKQEAEPASGDAQESPPRKEPDNTKADTDSGKEEEVKGQRPAQRSGRSTSKEKPTWIDHVAKHIDMIFVMVTDKTGDSETQKE